MKHKTYKLSILTLALILCLSIAAFFGIKFKTADAAGTVTVSDSNVFTSTKSTEGGSSTTRRLVVADKQGSTENPVYYTMFRFAYDDDTVSYRRNLAYTWWYGEQEDEEAKADDNGYVKTNPVQGWFNMEIGFKAVTFEKFTITFESQQYNKNKEKKSLNYIIFYPAASEGYVNVVISDDADAKPEEGAVALDAGYLTVAFTAKDEDKYGTGTYTVSVKDELENVQEGYLDNVGGNYSKSSTSSSSPVYPLIFNAKFAENNEAVADMVLYNLNGQSFQVNKSTSSTSGLLTSTTPSHDDTYDYYYGGTVYDDMPPVLCTTKEFAHFGYGDKLDFDYVLIDVLRSSPSETLYYYVLSVDQYNDAEITDYNNYSLFSEAKDNVTLVTGVKENYLPKSEGVYGENLVLDSAVKVYLKLADTTSSGSETYVYLDWYIDGKYLLNIKDTKFIAVAKDKQGVTYKYDAEDGKSFKDDGVVADYQAKVDEAAKNLSAGSSSYFYLPSVEDLFEDNATAYTDLKFSVYFYHNSQSSNTGLASNNLSINVTQRGAYTFTVYATDAAGNNMYYIDGGKVVEIETGDIWDMYKDKDPDGGYYRLPWFTFDVGYTGAEFEETPGLQSTAYVGTSYSSAAFKVNGISGTYSTTYRLFLFDRAGYYNAEGVTFTYEEFIKQMDDLYKNHREYFTEIPEVSESDADYDKYKDYEWKKTATNFTPQDENAFYYIRAEVTDNQYNTKISSSLAVVASVNAKTLKGESYWLKNNMTAVILLGVAGLALVGIILLLVIKPKDKSDIDVQFENSKKKTNKK